MGWDWGIVLGVVGLVLTVVYGPGIFQMIGGAPKLLPGFAVQDGNKSRNLIFSLSNAPIESRLLRFLRVYRQDVQVTVSFKVTELTGWDVAYVTKPIVTFGDDASTQAATLRAPWHMGVLVLSHKDEAFITRADTEIGVKLKPGTYLAEFVAASNDRTRRYERQFVVGADPAKTSWIN